MLRRRRSPALGFLREYLGISEAFDAVRFTEPKNERPHNRYVEQAEPWDRGIPLQKVLSVQVLSPWARVLQVTPAERRAASKEIPLLGVTAAGKLTRRRLNADRILWEIDSAKGVVAKVEAALLDPQGAVARAWGSTHGEMVSQCPDTRLN